MEAGQEIDISDLAVQGELDLSSVTVRGRVRINGVTFEHAVSLQGTRFEKETDFSSCVFSNGIQLSSLRVAGPLSFIGSEINGTDLIDASEMRVEGSLFLSNARIGGPGSPIHLNLQAAHIGGDLRLDGAEVSGSLGLSEAHICKTLFLTNLLKDQHRTWIGGDIIGQNCHVQGQFLAAGTKIDGLVMLKGARLDSEVHFEINVINGERTHIGSGKPGSIALSFRSAVVEGPLYLGGVYLEGRLDLEGVKLALQIFCAVGQRVPSVTDNQAQEIDVVTPELVVPVIGMDKNGISVGAIEAVIGGQVNFGGAQLAGMLNFQGANMASSLLCNDTVIGNNAQGVSVYAESATFGGLVTFSGAQLAGQLDISAAKLHGNFICTYLRVSLPLIGTDQWGVSVRANMVTIAGKVDFSGAQLAGQLDISAAKLHGSFICTPWNGSLPFIGMDQRGVSVQANLVTIAGQAILSGAQLAGSLFLQLANLKAGLLCPPSNGAVLRIGSKKGGVSLNAYGATFGAVVEISGARLAGKLNIECAKLAAGFYLQEEDGFVPEIGRDDDGFSVWGLGAVVEGEMSFGGARLAGALNLEGAKVVGPLNCRERNGVAPEIGMNGIRKSILTARAIFGSNADFSGAKLEGTLDLGGAMIAGALCFDTRNGAVTKIGTDQRNAIDNAGISVLAPGASIGGQVIFDGAHLDGLLVFIGAELKSNLLCRRVWLGGGLLMDAASVRHGVCLNGTYFGGDRSIWLSGARIEGHLEVADAVAKGQTNLSSARVGDWVCFDGSDLGGLVDLTSAKINRELAFGGRTFCESGASGKKATRLRSGLSLRRTEIAGDLLFWGCSVGPSPGSFYSRPLDPILTRDYCGLEADEELRLLESQIEGLTHRVEHLKRLFEGCSGPALGEEPVAPGAEPHALYLREELEARRSELATLRIRAAEFRTRGGAAATETTEDKMVPSRTASFPQFSEFPSSFSGMEQFGLKIDPGGADNESYMSELGNLFRRLRLTYGGEDDPKMTGVEKAIGWLVFLESKKGESGVESYREQLKRAVEEAEQRPAVDFRHLIVQGQLRWGHTEGIGSFAQDQSRWSQKAWPRYEGDLAADEVRGCVNAEALRVDGDLEMVGLRLRGSLLLEDAVVCGELNLLHSVIGGHLNLRSSEVRGQMFGRLREKDVSPEVRGKLMLNAAKLGEMMLRFVPPQLGGGHSGAVPYRVDLSHAQIKRLVIGGELAKGQAPCLRLAGLQFEELDVRELTAQSESIATTDSQAGFTGALVTRFRGFWSGLMKDSSAQEQHLIFLNQMDGFNAAVFTETERWLRNRGEDRLADGVYLQMRRDEMKQMTGLRQWPRRVLHGILLKTVGYGVKTKRLLVAWLILFLLLWVFFLPPASVEHPTSFGAPVVTPEVQPAPSTLTLEAKASLLRGRILATQPPWATPAPVAGEFLRPGWHVEWTQPATSWTGRLVPAGNPPVQAGEVIWSGSGGRPKSEDWNSSDAAWTAFRVAMPLVHFYARDEWEPSSRPVLRWFTYEGIASLAELLCYIIWPLLLTSWSGLLKKR